MHPFRVFTGLVRAVRLMEVTREPVLTAVIVDWDHAFADRLSLMLRRGLGLKVLALAATLAAGVAACVFHRPSLAVIDADLSTTCGLPILDTLVISSPATAIVLLSGRSPCTTCPFTHGLRMWIDCRLSKDLTGDEMTAALQSMLQGLASRQGSPHA